MLIIGKIKVGLMGKNHIKNSTNYNTVKEKMFVTIIF